MEKQLLVSVVVAIYNIDQYLKKCIESIVKQTYSNVEIILVDDGSKDNSGAICDAYSEIDERIKVIHQVNKGLVNARKAGVSIVTGDYVLFVDGDDWMDCDYVEQMVSCVQKNDNPDMIICGYKQESNGELLNIRHYFESGEYSGEKLLELKKRALYTGKFYEPGINPALWNKLFSADIVKRSNIDVDDKIKMGEDVAFFFPRLIRSNRVVIDNTITGYHYFYLPGSMSHKYDKSYFQRINVLYNELIDGQLDEELFSSIRAYYLFLFLSGIKLLLVDVHNICFIGSILDKAEGIEIIKTIIGDMSDVKFDELDKKILCRISSGKYNKILFDYIRIIIKGKFSFG